MELAAYGQAEMRRDQEMAIRKVLAAVAFLAALYAALLAASTGPSMSGQSALARPRQVQVELIAENAAVRPGDTITVALHQIIAPGWHTYWRNAGDAGQPTTVEWSLPPGATASDLRWPLPHVIAIGAATDYGYSDEVVLLADITLPKDLTGSNAELTANVSWLVCKDICVPEETTVHLSLPVAGSETAPQATADAKVIAAARANLPGALPGSAQFDAAGNTLTLRVEKFDTPPGNTEFRFFPVQPEIIDNGKAQAVSFSDGDLLLRMSRSDPSGATPEKFEGVLAVETRKSDGQVERRGYDVSGAVKVSAAPAAADTAPPAGTPAKPKAEELTPVFDTAPPASPFDDVPYGLVLLYAVLGGLFLNLMPCVFPVLSLKALSLAREAAPAERQMHGLAYFLGVLASCLVMALVLIVVRAAGETIGWGTQFQSPVFLLVMMAMFLALGLNMSGVFEFGGRFAGAGDALTRLPGLTGYFFTGVLATLVATPCTAPYMAEALGYAFTQPWMRLSAALLALGTGVALPMLTLSYVPALGRWLPKPGAWMGTFKGLMAFPIYATVGWLLWVLSKQLGSDGVFAGLLTLTGIAFAAWLTGSARQPHPVRSGVALVIAAVAILAGVASLPAAPAQRNPKIPVKMQTSGLPYEPFSYARLNTLRTEHKPVFINLTAAWCFTCKVNEMMALRSTRIIQAFAERGVVAMKGDWTNADPEITALLRRFGRAGVPLYLLYSAEGGEPHVLPQILTEGIVLEHVAALPPASQTPAK